MRGKFPTKPPVIKTTTIKTSTNLPIRQRSMSMSTFEKPKFERPKAEVQKKEDAEKQADKQQVYGKKHSQANSSYGRMSSLFFSQQRSGTPLFNKPVLNQQQSRPITAGVEKKLRRHYAGKSKLEETAELMKKYEENNSTLPPNNPPVTVIKKPKELNCEGGGGKGPANIGALQALQERNELSELQHVSGTSVGSITAMLLAFGGKPDYLAKLASQPNNFLHDMPGYEAAQKAYFDRATVTDDPSEEVGRYGLEFALESAKNTATAIWEQGAYSAGKNLHTFLQDQCELLITNAAKKYPAILNEFADIRNPTFKELETAREKFPHAGLLDMTVTATRKTDGAEVKMNAKEKDFENVSIPLAVLASSAIPYVFQPVEINGQAYLDGGVRRNVGATSGQYKPEECMILGFKRPPVEPSLFETIVGTMSYYMFGTNYDLNKAATRIATDENTQGYKITVDQGELTTLNMNPTEEQLKSAITSGYESTKKQLDELDAKRKDNVQAQKPSDPNLSTTPTNTGPKK